MPPRTSPCSPSSILPPLAPSLIANPEETPLPLPLPPPPPPPSSSSLLHPCELMETTIRSLQRLVDMGLVLQPWIKHQWVSGIVDWRFHRDEPQNQKKKKPKKRKEKKWDGGIEVASKESKVKERNACCLILDSPSPSPCSPQPYPTTTTTTTTKVYPGSELLTWV
ncbi:hypothetical protein HMI54_002457 [Coelomomyces lativittatus]|nr:hypothetical protein HMI54_002457 [Coelomomyces lativittatus]